MILIVDDQPDTCRPLVLLLRIEGIPSECVRDPAEAAEAIEKFHPALVVLDQDMPRMSGLELLRRLRATPAGAALPVLFFTASEAGEAEARRMGALDWIAKGGTAWDELRYRVLKAYRGATATPPGTPDDEPDVAPPVLR